MIKCRHCGKKFSSHDALRQHHTAKHPNLPVSETRTKAAEVNLKLIVPVIAVVLLSVIALLALSSPQNSPSPSVELTTTPESVNAAGIGLAVGNLAPEFTLTDSEGRTLTRSSLSGKPVIIFFTTTWCVPCQIGAKELLKYDLETGGDAFHVVIVFVDPGEAVELIRGWKNTFGDKDWFTALDTTGMANAYRVQYLDTKYILDKNGVIVWKDFSLLRYETAKDILGKLIQKS